MYSISEKQSSSTINLTLFNNQARVGNRACNCHDYASQCREQQSAV